MKKGIYRHYKGKNYEVVNTAIHTETQEVLIVYKALYETDINNDGLWVRPIKMFTEHVQINGEDIPRFEYIGS